MPVVTYEHMVAGCTTFKDETLKLIEKLMDKRQSELDAIKEKLGTKKNRFRASDDKSYLIKQVQISELSALKWKLVHLQCGSIARRSLHDWKDRKSGKKTKYRK